MDDAGSAGACLLPGRTWESRKAVRGESRREQQFYRYYGPFRQMSDYGPQYCDVRDPEARKKHKAVSCPDKILTAFCQLGALRLKSRRCLIFFFDVNHAYIMAEATKSLSLENDAVHDPGDEVWMGHSVIPRDVACCETTVNLPSIPISASMDDDVRKSAFVVNDLTKHPDLSTRPYVTGYPNGRFYAGVPITTPDGVNIGAYCILDDKVRDGLAENDLIFLRDMSQTVMTHLETVRALSERQQNYRMMSGLGSFVRGAPDAGRKAPPATNMPMNEGGPGVQQHRAVEYRLPDALIDPIRTPLASSQSMNEYLTTKRETESSAGTLHFSGQSTIPRQPSNTTNETSLPNKQRHESLTSRAQTIKRNTPGVTKSSAAYASTHAPLRQQKIADDPKATYQRAAETLCQSLDIDGVAFLDASVRVFGGLSEAQNADPSEGTTTGDSDDSAGKFSQSDSAGEPQVSERICRVMGCAQTLRNDTTEATHTKREPQQKLTESFLRRLLRRNPDGKVWMFDKDFKSHPEDGSSLDESGGELKTASALSSGTQKRKAARRARRNDGETLQAAFPGSRCIALHGIWDYTRKRWAVAGLYWTLDPLRHIARETDMQFIASFCDIIVAETKRLEVVETDKAKSDFISTVSHELRSPLHGILGSCELLFDLGLDNTAMSFLEQIDSCGRTLLDIIEHLLDFASLKNQRISNGAVKSSRIGRKLVQEIANTSTDDMKAMDTSITLDDVTEDAVVSSVYSFHYGQNAEKHAQIPVILDIDRSDSKAWHCSLATGGWKRICINLVTNALKYTPSGFVQISLKQESLAGSDRRFSAVLTVADTGKGMSKEFQSNSLFQDFTQEDAMSEGLGLGMHMVSRIVYTMGGKIEVVSDQNGSGTRVTVRVPLEHSKKVPPRSDAGSKSSLVTTQKPFDVRKAGIVSGLDAPITAVDSLTSSILAMALSSIENNLEFLGIHHERCSWQCGNSHDLMIIMEDHVSRCLTTLRSRRSTNDDNNGRDEDDIPPMLVVCNTSLSAQSLRSSWAMDDLYSRVTTEHISLPCGVKQLTQAILSVLRLHEERRITARRESGNNEVSGQDHRLDDTAPHAARLHEQLQVRLLQPDAPEASVTDRVRDDPRRPSFKDTKRFSRRTSLAEVHPGHQLGRHMSAPALDAESTPTAALGARVTETPIPPAISLAVRPDARIPMLLLVDDNNVNLRLLATFAKKHGYPHVTAQNGQLAVDAFVDAHEKHVAQNSIQSHETGIVNTGMPNIILMDINMPVMDGYEAVQRIRAYEKQHRMRASKIIAVTALQSDAAQVEAFGSGFDMFLCKPLRLKDLVQFIEACL